MTITAWDGDAIPNQNGRFVVITGASSGIGKETACALWKLSEEMTGIKY